MNGQFIRTTDVDREQLDWGELGWISRPPKTGAEHITAIEVTLIPGGGHDFHRHPTQEELIYVLSGRIVQWLETKKQELHPGDSIFIPTGVIHASFNESDEPARLMVMLGPCDGETGYVVEEVADQAPWNALR